MKSICVHLISWMLCGVFLGSCQENTAFTAGKCHSVQQLLDSKEAKVACDEKASFEGKTLCLSGLLEVSNDPRPLPRNFFLLSTINPNRAVEIQFEAEVAAKIIPKVLQNGVQNWTSKKAPNTYPTSTVPSSFLYCSDGVGGYLR